MPPLPFTLAITILMRLLLSSGGRVGEVGGHLICSPGLLLTCTPAFGTLPLFFFFCIFSAFLPPSFFHSAYKEALDNFTPSSKSFLHSQPLIPFFIIFLFCKILSMASAHHIPLGYRILTDLCFLFKFFSVFPRFYSFFSFEYRSLNFSCYAN